MSIQREEKIISGTCEPSPESWPGVVLRGFAVESIGAHGFSTGMATYAAGATMPHHVHDVSEAITILEGSARVLVTGREYILSPYDCMHMPAGTAHSVVNITAASTMRVHSAFGSARPLTELVQDHFPAGCPETILRFEECPVYELSPGAFFRDLFARRLGSVGICGGYGLFNPGASLPCHTHNYDESITIVSGEANCLVRGHQYRLNGYDTAFVPRGQPHRFINQSGASMAMIWVYAGDEPDRLVVDGRYCSGDLIWPTRNLL